MAIASQSSHNNNTLLFLLENHPPTKATKKSPSYFGLDHFLVRNIQDLLQLIALGENYLPVNWKVIFTQSERQHGTQMTAKQIESSSQKLENDIKYASPPE